MFACVYDTRENNMQVLAKENYYIESSRRWVLWGEMYSLKKSKLWVISLKGDADIWKTKSCN